MAEANTPTENSNAFLEWMRPFIDDEQINSELEGQLDMFKSENIVTETE